jgi:cytidyltransferase-like protein
MKSKIIIVSGYFNPLHKGHIEYFKIAKKLGDKLFVIVNNDNQRKIKESKEFMLQQERVLIVNELSITDKVFLSIDQDRSVSLTIKKIHSIYFSNYRLFFVNGGDQTNSFIPEAKICAELGIELVDGLGDKIQSSSWLLNKK